MELIIIIILLAVGIYCLLKLLTKNNFKFPFKINKFNSRPPINLSTSWSEANKVQGSSELDSLKKRLRILLYGDSDAQKRIIQSERKRNPHKSEAELYQNAIERLERDRRR